MEPEGIFPCPQHLATCAYPAQEKSSSCPCSFLFKIYFNIILPVPSGPFPSDILTTATYAFLSSIMSVTCVTHLTLPEYTSNVWRRMHIITFLIMHYMKLLTMDIMQFLTMQFSPGSSYVRISSSAHRSQKYPPCILP